MVGESTTLSAGCPPQVAALLAQATHFLKAGRPAEAVVPLRAAARWLPVNAAMFHDLGLACLDCGQVTEAIEALRTSIAIDPAFQDSHLRLGIALELAGSSDGALAAYQRAAQLSAREPRAQLEATYRAANLLDALGHAPRAIEMFRRAATIAPQSSSSQLALARALVLENCDAEAEKVLRRVLETEPNHAVALDLLGNTLADGGRFVEARGCFLRAIEQAPLLAGSYYELVRCGRIGPEDTDLVARMRAALEQPNLEPAQRIRVHLALGKAAEDLGNFEEAMRQFDAAESLRNRIVRFDLGTFEARVDRLIAHFTPELLAAAASAPASEKQPTPILIVGLPRSGTTLIEQILSAHPDVSAGGELSFWNERGSAWDRAGSPQAKAAQLEASASDYLRLLQNIARGAAYVTDKMPLNFQWAGLIHLALPGAIILHCRRNPLDTALSIHQTHFNPRMTFPTGGAALVGYIRAYQRLCAHWRRVLPPERFIEIDYEDLVESPEAAIRRILQASGIGWDSACLSPERNPRAVKTPSKWQTRQPIYRHAIGRPRFYEPWLGPLGLLRS